MSDLNTLNNKELREKCLQYGLPNVPVTDSSRKVLIRKLQNAMQSGKKVSSPKVSTPTNRRKTVHATITTTVSSGDEDDFSITTKRTTQNPERRRTVAPSASVPKKTPPNLATKPPNQYVAPMNIETRFTPSNAGNISSTNNQSHLRRSVSLTKTGVLTTSYSTETVPVRNTYEQDILDGVDEKEDELDDVEMESIAESEHTYTKAVYHDIDRNNYSRANYIAPNYTSPGYNVSSYNTTPSPSSLSPSQQKLYPDLHSANLQNDYFNSYDGMRASHSSTARQNNLSYTHNAPTSYLPSSTSPSLSSTAYNSYNRQTIAGSSGYGSILNPLNTTNASPMQSSNTKHYTMTGVTKRHTARAVDNDEYGASSSDDQYEAPYLSKFSRNLDTLQTEPLIKRSPTPGEGKMSSSRYSSYSPNAPKRRRATHGDDGITFSQFWESLEERYHLKQAFFIMFCFIAAVFIYVFFLQ